MDRKTENNKMACAMFDLVLNFSLKIKIQPNNNAKNPPNNDNTS